MYITKAQTFEFNIDRDTNNNAKCRLDVPKHIVIWIFT